MLEKNMLIVSHLSYLKIMGYRRKRNIETQEMYPFGFVPHVISIRIIVLWFCEIHSFHYFNYVNKQF